MGKKDETIAELLGEMQHCCIVVKDVEETVKHFSKMGFEFADIRTDEIMRPDTTLRGKPCPHRLKQAFSKNTKPAFQITEVFEGSPNQKEFIEAKGPGVHHICYSVDDLDVVVAKFKKLGINVLQAGSTWRFMDTSNMCGCIIEIIQRKH